MPELPDITVFVEALRNRTVNRTLVSAGIAGPFVLRTVTPPLADVPGARVRKIRRDHVGRPFAVASAQKRLAAKC